VICALAGRIAVLGAAKASTEVTEDHVQELNASESARNEAVGSAIAKFSPETLTDEPPETPALRKPNERTAASKVKMFGLDPTSAFTVR